jgi:hypothetical protein
MKAAAGLALPDQRERASTSIRKTLTGHAAEGAAKSAIAKRAESPLLPLLFSAQALLPRLPLPFPRDADCPPSPKTRYRSAYHYPGPQALLEEGKLATMSDFQICLHLLDFSPMRDELARIYRPSHKGQAPFDPVSMALSVCLRREKRLSWNATSTLLKSEEGAPWRRLFGFAEGQTPSASGLRDFFGKVGGEFFADLCPRSIDLLRRQGLFPQHSTYPGDPEDRGVSLCQDGMLHSARSRPRCQLATEECYRPVASTLGPQGPSDEDLADRGGSAPKAGRPCRARDRGLEGCTCDTPECAQQCRRASRLDKEARFTHYEGHNHKHDQQASETKGKGIDLFGYRSVADRVLDDRFAVAWTLRSKLYPANTDERSVFKLDLTQVKQRFIELSIGEVLADSGLGYGECLNAVWETGALRMIDIREDPSDKDFEACLGRGYDGKGHPLCPHGYPMSPNGYDYERRRAKYVCNQICRRVPLRGDQPVQPPSGCPYLDPSHPPGSVQNLGRAFRDGSVRLAREIPYGSDGWKARYGRRNLSESRNGQLQMLGLKRMHSYGLGRNEKEMQLADFLINLHTLGRLVRQATTMNRN